MITIKFSFAETSTNLNTNISWKKVVSEQSGSITETILGLTYGNNMFVAVGNNGAIYTSSDGITWTARTSGAISQLVGVTWTGKLFVVTGCMHKNGMPYGLILTSPDGITWTERDSKADFYLEHSASNGEIIVAVGDSSITTSTDGINWTERSFIYCGGLKDITWDGKKFIAVSATGSIITSANGIEWSNPRQITDDWLVRIVWNGSIMVTVGLNGTILTSPDSDKWTQRQSGELANLLYSLIWDGSRFTAVGQGILTSPDGIIWTKQDNAGIKDLLLDDVSSDGNQLIAMGMGTILRSYDSKEWERISDEYTGVSFNDVECNGKIFVAVGDVINFSTNMVHKLVKVSEDGLIWKQVILDTGMLMSIVWDGKEFISVGTNFGKVTVMSSVDGLNWTDKAVSVTGFLNDISWNGKQFLAVGKNEDGSLIISSEDGTNWVQRSMSYKEELTSICYYDNTYFVSGNDGSIYKSADGVNWSISFNDPRLNIVNITNIKDGIAASSGIKGSEGTEVLLSKDGINWDVLMKEDIRYLKYLNGILFGIGEVGNINASLDGIYWDEFGKVTEDMLKALACNQSIYVVVGDSGTIINGFVQDSPKILKDIKIAGTIVPDFIYPPHTANIETGFKVEVVGKSISTYTNTFGDFELCIKSPFNFIDDIDIKITKPGYLTREFKNISIYEYLQISPMSMWAGDINGDNAINISDIMEVAKGYCSIEGDGRYVADCDFNKDGVINIVDIIIVAKHFNVSSF